MKIAVCAGAFAAGLVLPLVLVPRPHAQHVIVPEPVPLVVTHPAPIARIVQHADCTRPTSQIGIVGSESSDTLRHGVVTGVAASARGCTIAVWTARDVVVSRDDGLTFRTLPWHAGAISAAVDGDATVYVAHDGELAMIDASGGVTQRALPARDLGNVAVSGRWIVVRSDRRLAASRDAGVTWRVVALPADGITTSAVRIDNDGAVHLAAASGAGAPLRYYLGSLDGGNWRTIWTSPPATPYRDSGTYPSIHAFAFGNDGALYAERYDAYGFHLFVVTGDGRIATADALADPAVLRGVTILGTERIVGARDAHDGPLALWNNDGPIRPTDGPRDHMFGACCANEGRWLVGSVVEL